MNAQDLPTVATTAAATVSPALPAFVQGLAFCAPIATISPKHSASPCTKAGKAMVRVGTDWAAKLGRSAVFMRGSLPAAMGEAKLNLLKIH